MKKSYIALAVAILAITVGCRRSDIETPERDQKTLTLTVERSDFDSPYAEQDSVARILQKAFSNKDAAATRATETAFEPGDKFGLYVHTTAVMGATGIHTPNLSYTTSDGTVWSAEGYLQDVLKTGTAYYATAYYPYVVRVSDPLAMVHSVEVDQSVAGAISASDLLYSAPVAITNPTTAPAVALSFKHLLSKIAVKFTVPSSIEGAIVTGIDRVVAHSVSRSATISLADGSMSKLENSGDVQFALTTGMIAEGNEVVYEGVIPPQTIAKGAKMIEIYFTTSAGAKSFVYSLDAELKLVPNQKHTFSLVSIGDLCFASTLDLTDGLAHTNMPLKIKAVAGATWTLTSAQPWLKLSTQTTDTPAASIAGTGNGGEQTIYVSVTANTSMTGTFWEPRSAALTLAIAGAKSTYTAMQNFYRFELETKTRQIAASQAVIGAEGFGANQVWSAASSEPWLKLATSIIYGQGDPASSYGPINGSLESAKLYYQIEANNTDAVRTATVVFTPTTAGGKGAAITFEQAAGSVRVSTTSVMLSGAAATGVDMFDVTVSPGLNWKILSATGVTTTPAVGAEQVGLGTPLAIKGTWSANNTTDVIAGSIVIAYGSYGATQQRTITLSQAPEFIVIAGTRWATGNLVGNGVNGARIGAPTDGGLYFQYGGLIGYKGGDKGDGTGFPTVTQNKFWGNAAAFSSNDVAITPTGYTKGTDKWPYFYNLATGGYGYYYYNNFTVQYADFSTQANGKDVALGIGDPCATYLGGAWRLPRYDELVAIVGSSIDGAVIPWSDPSIQGKWQRPSSTIPVDGTWFGSNSRSGSPAINTDLFIPAAGLRQYNNGEFSYIGIRSFFWGLSIYDYYRGYALQSLEVEGVLPSDIHNRANSMPVRCVQDEPYAPTPPKADDYIVLNGLKWAKGNLVARGTKNCEIGQPSDGGLYFQYGGLIGYKGGVGGDGRGIPNIADGKFWSGAAAFSSNDVKVTPTGYVKSTATWPNFDNKSSDGYGYYYYSTFVTKYMDFQTQANSRDVPLGIGDPCAYYLGDGWRMPTYVELSAITGNANEGSSVPWATAGVTGRWEKAGPQSAIGAWFGPNSRSGTPTIKTDLFIAASGHRTSGSSAYGLVGVYGYAWSSSVYNLRYGFYFEIHESNGVYPRASNSRANAFPMRCVSDIPATPTPPTEAQTVVINGLKWTKGNLIANGANGCKVGAATDGGLYFQFGSLIGWAGGASGDGIGVPAAGSPTVPALAIKVKPTAYAGSTAWNTAWVGDPKNQNVANGFGDPCKFYLGSPWRLPTATEISTLYSNVANGTLWPNCPTGAWQASPAGSWAGPGAKTANATNSIFIPSQGLRANSGAMNYVNMYGYVWTSTPSTGVNSSFLDFNVGGVNAQSKISREIGLPVRCVSDAPTTPTPPTADQIVTINGLKWTKGNLVANGGANCKVGQPGDGGLYFQYGGLIGYKGGAYGDGTGIPIKANGTYWDGATTFSSNDVAVTPATYTKQKDAWLNFDNLSSGGYGYYYFSSLDKRYEDFQTQPNANNPALGIGDPCTYYLGSPWRLPKYNELSAITGSTTENAWVPWSTAGVTGRWEKTGPQSAVGAWFGPNSRTGTPTVATDLFIPAVGYRVYNNGAFGLVGANAYVWSSSVGKSYFGFYLDTHEYSGVVPRNYNYRSTAMSVRCVSN